MTPGYVRDERVDTRQLDLNSGKRRRLVVEINLHPHVADRFDEVGLVGKQQARPARLDNDFPRRLDIDESQLALENPHDTPDAQLRSMVAAQRPRQGLRVEYGRRAIGLRCVRICHFKALWMKDRSAPLET